MKKLKPLRRQSNLRRSLLLTKYYAQKSLHVPAVSLLFGLTAISGLIALVAGILLVILLMQWSIRGFPLTEAFILSFTNNFAFLLIGVKISKRSFRKLRETFKPPLGHFLNPLPPEPNEILPENEVLVRASIPNNSALLLRADTANRSDPVPETLLRPVNDDRRA